jgi:adenylate kinase
MNGHNAVRRSSFFVYRSVKVLMRVIITGQVGVDKGPYLERVEEMARGAGKKLKVFHVGRMMYEEAPDVPEGRILNLPMGRLNTLRRAVFKEILREADRHENVILNTHATFRWRHGLFAAFDFDQIKAFNADAYVTLLDNVESVHQRLLRDHDVDHTLKDSGIRSPSGCRRSGTGAARRVSTSPPTASWDKTSRAGTFRPC